MKKRLEPNVVRLTKEMVSIPTVTGGEASVAELIEAELKSAGMKVDRQEVEGAGFNILASRGEGGLLFLTHLDVFPPYDHPAPFEPKVEGGEIVGRGAADAKGQIAALLVALRESEEPAEVALVVDEERLGRGSVALEIPQGCQGAVVLEPTNLEICLSQAGSIEVEIETWGKAAHGSTPWEGENAIDKALCIYERLKKLPIVKEKSNFFPKGGWVVLGRIEGGYEPMVVPKRCFMHIDIGFAPGVDPKEAERQVREAAREALSVRVIDLWEGFEVEESSKVVRALLEAFKRATGGGAKVSGMPSWTDASNLLRKGVTPVIFGAGKLSAAHSDKEALPIPQLLKMVGVLRELIRLWPNFE